MPDILWILPIIALVMPFVLLFCLEGGPRNVVRWLRGRRSEPRVPRMTTAKRLQLIGNMPIEYITPAFVAGESNVEIRNALIRRVGMSDYMKMIKAHLKSRDDFGEIYAYRSGMREFWAVKVVNSTPEADGSFKDFWLRIPSDSVTQPARFCFVCGRNIAETIYSPKQGIAWTFSLCESHYNPQVMS